MTVLWLAMRIAMMDSQLSVNDANLGVKMDYISVGIAQIAQLSSFLKVLTNQFVLKLDGIGF